MAIWCQGCSAGYDYAEVERWITCECGERVLLRPPSQERDLRPTNGVSRDVLKAERKKLRKELNQAFLEGRVSDFRRLADEMKNVLRAGADGTGGEADRKHDRLRAGHAVAAIRQAIAQGDSEAALAADDDLWEILDRDP